ncbi:hypothetical protein EV145_11044 [Flavobacterium sp. 245]|nr:hypothetical protein EV145_11044 [Flavobacterium sp. 245]
MVITILYRHSNQAVFLSSPLINALACIEIIAVLVLIYTYGQICFLYFFFSLFCIIQYKEFILKKTFTNNFTFAGETKLINQERWN